MAQPITTRNMPRTALNPSQAAARNALLNQQSVTDYPYNSSVCFRQTPTDLIVGAAKVADQYVFAKGDVRRAFAFAVGQSGVIAGFNDAIDGMMTLAETNLVKPNETIAGQQVQIDGLAIFCKPAMTDGQRYLQARLLAQIATNVSVKLGVNGDQNTFALGTIQMIPAAGGIVGIGNDDLSFIPKAFDKQPPNGNVGQDYPFCQNGWQTRGNYYRFPAGIIWNPAGERDSLLNVVFTNEREFKVITGGDPDRPQLQDDGAVPPVSFAPAKVGVVLGVQLIGQVVGARTATA